jgi:hypothetical protein
MGLVWSVFLSKQNFQGGRLGGTGRLPLFMGTRILPQKAGAVAGIFISRQNLLNIAADDPSSGWEVNLAANFTLAGMTGEIQ